MSITLRCAAILILLATACSPMNNKMTENGAASDDAPVVAVVEGQAITLTDLDEWIKDGLFEEQVGGKSAADVFTFREAALDRLINERLVEAEAKRQGIDPDEVMRQGVKPEPVTDEEISAFFEENRARIGNRTLEELSDRIRSHLAREKLNQATTAYLTSLRDHADLSITFEAPRVDVAAVGPSVGPADAKVTIIEFSDFQCPFCGRVEPTIKEIRERYPDDVRIVYRHFPLSFHNRALAAAEAAACADKQGKFWEYHNLLFANNKALEDADLERYAEEIGLESDAFKACVSERETQQMVEVDINDGRTAGVSGTPAFFINGVMLGGARPIEDFVKLIDKELGSPEANPRTAAQ